MIPMEHGIRYWVRMPIYLYGQAERALFADLARGGDPAALKSEYMRRLSRSHAPALLPLS